MNFQDLFEFDTKLTADVTEWRPNSPGNHLACGTYFLDKEKNQRLGIIYLLKLGDTQLDTLDTYEFKESGILDLKWLDSKNLLTIDSNNILKKFSIEENIKLSKELSLSEEKSIGLTIDFMSDTIVTSDTLGYLNITKILQDELSLERSFKAHELETWSVLIDRNDSNTIYSGADDCTLKMWDLRESNRKAGECKLFEGGVVSIILPQRPDLTWLDNYNSFNVLCGSYDEKIYVLDKRNMKRSVRESKKLNGGVWKMKLHVDQSLVLCACMHTGVHVVNLDTLESDLYYDGHGLNNLAYGCDWKKVDENSNLVASCSFYNHQLKIWKLNLK